MGIEVGVDEIFLPTSQKRDVGHPALYQGTLFAGAEALLSQA
jgi:hypothetical protein